MAEHKRHQGHRQRMRERVQNYGLDSLADHEVLEYILYTTNAQRDTNEIAYNLLERFGDFASVLEASEEELCTVEGIGPTSARLLHMLPQVSRYYGRCRTDGKRCFNTTEQLGSYLMAKFAWSDYERAMLVSLSTRRHIKAAVWLREGTSDRVSLDVKDVVAAVNASKEKIAQLEASKKKETAQEAEPVEESDDAKTCSVCGTVSDSNFCPHCGAPMGK